MSSVPLLNSGAIELVLHPLAHPGSIMAAVSVFITILVLAHCLCVRSGTWRNRWEMGITLYVACSAAGLILVTPIASAVLGPLLHRFSGQWNLEDYIGHLCCLGATAALAYATTSRLLPLSEIKPLTLARIRYPGVTVALALLLVFVMSRASNHYETNFLNAVRGPWIRWYWLLLCGMLIYYQTYTCRALWILRAHPPSRSMATVYLISPVTGIFACAAQAARCLSPNLHDTPIITVLACLSTTAVGLSATRSWRTKVRQLYGACVTASV